MNSNRKIKDFFSTIERPSKHPRYDATQNEIDKDAPSNSTGAETAKLTSTDLVEQSAHDGTGNISARVSTQFHQGVNSRIKEEAELPEMSSTNHDPPFARSSFTSNLSSFSSQRVVRNGEMMVTNSDDELGSDSSLGDIDELLCQPTSRVHLPIVNRKTEGVHSRPIHKSEPIRGGHHPMTGQDRPKHKYSLDTLTTRTEREKISGGRLEEVILDLEESDNRILALEHNLLESNVTKDHDPTELASMMLEKMEDNSIEKIMQAMERTEVLQNKKHWAFFTSRPANEVSSDFPSIHGTVLEDLLSNDLDRGAAFSGGFLSEFAEYGKIPVQLLEWMISVLPFERRTDLQEAYHCLFKTCSSQTGSLLTVDRLESLFRCLGASEEAINQGCSLEPTTILPPGVSSFGDSRECLGSVLRLLFTVAESMSEESRSRALCLLLRLAVDDGFDANADLLMSLQKGISAMLDSITESSIDEYMESHIVDIVAHVKDTHLRLQLLRNLTAPQPIISEFRRRLALSLFFEELELPVEHVDYKISMVEISKSLRKQSLDIRSGTNFALLHARIEILDIAIDDAGRPSDGETEAAISFNEDVDRLAQAIKGVSTRIRDTGANHLSRTEAKEALEALHARLEYAVRTKPKPKRSIFGEVEGKASKGQKDLMSKFLKASNT